MNTAINRKSKNTNKMRQQRVKNMNKLINNYLISKTNVFTFTRRLNSRTSW